MRELRSGGDCKRNPHSDRKRAPTLPRQAATAVAARKGERRDALVSGRQIRFTLAQLGIRGYGRCGAIPLRSRLLVVAGATIATTGWHCSVAWSSSIEVLRATCVRSLPYGLCRNAVVIDWRYWAMTTTNCLERTLLCTMLHHELENTELRIVRCLLASSPAGRLRHYRARRVARSRPRATERHELPDERSPRPLPILR